MTTVSADPQTRDKCRYLALGQKRNIGYFETEFQPNQTAGGFWAPVERANNQVTETLWATEATSTYAV